jgi:hypothetical protein
MSAEGLPVRRVGPVGWPGRTRHHARRHVYLQDSFAGCACTFFPGGFLNLFLFSDVCRTIALHAFAKSPFPLILSLESHLSYEQQEIAARIFVEELGFQTILFLFLIMN